MNLQWTDFYKIVTKPTGYIICHADGRGNGWSVNFTVYKYEGSARGVAKRMFRREMNKIEKLLTCTGESTTK